MLRSQSNGTETIKNTTNDSKRLLNEVIENEINMYTSLLLPVIAGKEIVAGCVVPGHGVGGGAGAGQTQGWPNKFGK